MRRLALLRSPGTWQADNCCSCNTGPQSSAVTAYMFWPGFFPFTTNGTADLFGVKYLTLTATVNDIVAGVVTHSLTCDSLNGTITGDGTTGTAPPAGYSATWPAWPPTLVKATHIEWGGSSGPGTLQVDLSNPISLATIKADCITLLASLDVSTVALNDEKRVRYNWDTTPNFEFAISADWPVFNVDPTTGLFYWMSAVSQAAFNTPATPFAHVAPAIVTEDITAGPVSPESESFYTQEAVWQMRKTFSSPVSGSTCCEDDYYDYVNVATPSPVCQMIPDDGHGHLILNPPDLAADASDNSHMVIRTPHWGKSLTGGGCPCA